MPGSGDLTGTVRRKEGCDMALHCWEKLRQLRNAWYVLLRRGRQVFADFGAETKHFIYFYLGHVAILLFKTQ